MIKGKGISFIPLDASNLDNIFKLLNDKDNLMTFLTKSFYMKSHKELEKLYINEVLEDDIHYVVTSNIGNFLGLISFNMISKDKKLSISLILDRQIPNFFYKFKEALDLGINYAFNDLNFNKVKFTVNEVDEINKKNNKNEISITDILNDLNFNLETKSREDVFIDGRYWDVYSYGLLRR